MKHLIAIIGGLVVGAGAVAFLAGAPNSKAATEPEFCIATGPRFESSIAGVIASDNCAEEHGERTAIEVGNHSTGNMLQIADKKKGSFCKKIRSNSECVSHQECMWIKGQCIPK